MFCHNFKYVLTTLLKDKMLIFWTLGFPLILGTFFNMAFADIESSEKADIIDIAIVEEASAQEHSTIKEALLSMSEEGSEIQLFHSEVLSEADARQKLEDDEIVGYVYLKDTPQVVIKTNGISQTILQYVCDQIMQTSYMIHDVANAGMEAKLQEAMSRGEQITQEQLMQQVYEEAAAMMEENEEWLVDESNSHMSYTMIEFYTLIAMTCMYGGILGMVAINRNLANMSSKGQRVAVSPAPKGVLILSSACAAYLIQLVGIALLFAYTIFALQVDYGEHFPQLVLLAVIGCFAGLSLGVMLAALLKKNEDTKTGILIAVTMLGCFLAGMMGITMKYVIDTNFPLLNRINPVNMITDGLYSLYYYGTFDRYYQNVIGLLLFSLLMLIVSMNFLRRQKYDHL